LIPCGAFANLATEIADSVVKWLNAACVGLLQAEQDSGHSFFAVSLQKSHGIRKQRLTAGKMTAFNFLPDERFQFAIEFNHGITSRFPCRA
jgi:hypothetical protein